MGYFILGLIAGYVFSDIITAQVPQVGQFKVLPGPTAVIPQQTQQQKSMNYFEYLRKLAQGEELIQ